MAELTESGEIENLLVSYFTQDAELNKENPDARVSLKLIKDCAKAIKKRVLEAIPPRKEQVADEYTYGDTGFNSNTVRYGYNEAVRDFKQAVEKL